jgi:hypothetical protein
MPFELKGECAKAIVTANLERLARLIKVYEVLMQTKAYLFS